MPRLSVRAVFFFFFFNDTATTEIYTLSLHDALPISATKRNGSAPYSGVPRVRLAVEETSAEEAGQLAARVRLDRKSTRLNSSHLVISYAVFCLKKKKNRHQNEPQVSTSTSTSQV